MFLTHDLDKDSTRLDSSRKGPKGEFVPGHARSTSAAGPISKMPRSDRSLRNDKGERINDKGDRVDPIGKPLVSVSTDSPPGESKRRSGPRGEKLERETSGKSIGGAVQKRHKVPPEGSSGAKASQDLRRADSNKRDPSPLKGSNSKSRPNSGEVSGALSGANTPGEIPITFTGPNVRSIPFCLLAAAFLTTLPFGRLQSVNRLL